MKNTDVTKDDIKAVFGGIIARENEKFKTMTQEDLEKHWYFTYDSTKSTIWRVL